jgi:hypothetical protein
MLASERVGRGLRHLLASPPLYRRPAAYEAVVFCGRCGGVRFGGVRFGLSRRRSALFLLGLSALSPRCRRADDRLSSAALVVTPPETGEGLRTESTGPDLEGRSRDRLPLIDDGVPSPLHAGSRNQRRRACSRILLSEGAVVSDRRRNHQRTAVTPADPVGASRRSFSTI